MHFLLHPASPNQFNFPYTKENRQQKPMNSFLRKKNYVSIVQNAIKIILVYDLTAPFGKVIRPYEPTRVFLH